MPTASAQLEAAKALIDTPDKWIKGVTCVNEKNEVRGTGDPTACRFCALGAIWHTEETSKGHGSGAEAELRSTCYDLFGTWEISRVNDRAGTTHADVMKLYDMAIDRAKLKEAERK